MPRLVRFVLVALVACAVAGAAGGAPAPVRFTLFVQTDLPLGGIARTPGGWVYTSENTGRFRASDARGRGLKELAQIEQGGEEVRCEASPGGAGFVKGALYCHFPDDRIVRLRANGTFDVVAILPHAFAADGAMAFDTGGLFARGGIVAATGGSASNGGEVYVVRGNGRVRRVGAYPGPGGAENLVIAPSSVRPRVSLGRPCDRPDGRLRSRAGGRATRPGARARRRARQRRQPDRGDPGLAERAPAAVTAAGAVHRGHPPQERVCRNGRPAPPYVNTIVVGTELTGDFWTIRSNAAGYRATPLPTSLERTPWNLESAVYVR